MSGAYEGTYCDQGTYTVQSTTNLYVTFITDSQYIQRGFDASWTCMYIFYTILYIVFSVVIIIF